jgi:hypothetical protein
MTATIAASDLDGVVKRADDRWARRQGDEPASPEYLEVIVNAVRPLLGQPVTGPVDDVQVKQQLLADKQRLADLVDELRKQADARGKIVERQARELTALKQDLGAAGVDARRRVDAAAEAMQAPLKAAQDEVDRLTALTTELSSTVKARGAIIERREADVAQLHGTVDELRAKLTAVEQAKPPHQHRYVVDAPGTEPRPCACGQSYPRAAIATEDVEPSAPEPWAELFGQIRDEAKKAGWKA